MNKTFIDLFSGAGGMSCGLEMAGWECLLGVDFNKNAIETFQSNHPRADTFAGDIRELSTESIKALIGDSEVDLICGGPPCQGFSTIGQNNSEDNRNFLFLEFLRVVEALNPKYLIIENVTGLLSRKNEPTLKCIIQSLTDLGYTVDIKVLSAHLYGVPQKRRRTILLCNRFGLENVYPAPVGTDDFSFLSKPNTVGWAFGQLRTDSGEIFNHDIEKAAIKSPLEKKRIACIPQGKGIRYEKDQLAYLPEDLWFDVDWSELRESRFREVKLKRLSLNECSGTINTSKTTYYHPTEDRYLTVREAAAIQSFPPDFVFHGSVSQQWKQIGNAVPPLLAKALGEALLEAYEDRRYLHPSQSIQSVEDIRAGAFTYR